MYKTLDDLKKDKEKDKKKKTTDSYTGGTKSGINVENPKETKIKDNTKKSDKEGDDKFEEKEEVKITLYKNGFIFNDGPFRDFSDEKNKKFMKELESGYVPKELIKQGYKNISVAMDDSQKNEDYKEPIVEKKFEAFEGSGSKVGKQTSIGLKMNKEAKITNFDDKKEVANVSFRLHNGEVVTQSFNMTHKISDVYKYIEKVAPVKGTFKLLEGFPPKALEDKNKSVKDSGIHGSCLSQKLD